MEFVCTVLYQYQNQNKYERYSKKEENNKNNNFGGSWAVIIYLICKSLNGLVESQF